MEQREQMEYPIHKLAKDGSNWEELAEIAAGILTKEGHVIAVPTETIYGVATNLSPLSIDNLYRVKKRDLSKPVALCLSSVEEISTYGKQTVSDSILRELLPGPVTVVFERTPNLTKELNPGTSLIGMRIPDFPFLQAVVKKHGAFALTSANISNAQSSLSIEEFKELWPQLAAIFDAGVIPSVRFGSTVVDLSVPGHYSIIRDGQALENTTRVLKNHGLSPK